MNVISETGRAFTVTNARYTVKNSAGAEIDSGAAQVTDHELSTVIEMRTEGRIRVIFECDVDYEHVIGTTDIVVRAV